MRIRCSTGLFGWKFFPVQSSFLEQVYVSIIIGHKILYFLLVLVGFGVFWNEFDVLLDESTCSQNFGCYFVLIFFPVMVVDVIALKCELLRFFTTFGSMCVLVFWLCVFLLLVVGFLLWCFPNFPWSPIYKKW